MDLNKTMWRAQPWLAVALCQEITPVPQEGDGSTVTANTEGDALYLQGLLKMYLQSAGAGGLVPGQGGQG